MFEIKTAATNNITATDLVKEFFPQFISEMADCLWYYHMTDGRPELQDMIRKQDYSDIKDLFTSTAYDIYAQNLVLQKTYPEHIHQIQDIMILCYGAESDAICIMKEFYRIHDQDIWDIKHLWTDAKEDRRLQRILYDFQQVVLNRAPWQTETLGNSYQQVMKRYLDHLHNLQR